MIGLSHPSFSLQVEQVDNIKHVLISICGVEFELELTLGEKEVIGT
jgi:hypothetical protein